MLFALLYALFRRVIGSGRPTGDRELEIEVVVLRHQVKVLSRKAGRPKPRRIDKAFLAACSRALPRHRWGSFIVAPSTLLRWHRELVQRKWTFKRNPIGRPSTLSWPPSSAAWPGRTRDGATCASRASA